jgi:hypothetical protein
VARKIGNTHTNTLNWLSASHGRCLIVFDNADDPHVQLHKFFPQSPETDILITTRHRDLVLLAQGSNSDYNISAMNADDAQELLTRAARSGGDLKDEEREAAALLVQVLSPYDLHLFIS